MTTKSPTTSVRSREIIGVDQFSQRREVFDKYDTVFLPLPSPNAMAYKEAQPIVTSNHGKTTTNFKRNAPAFSSMRESRTDERNFEFRARKYSDNFTSELNQSDDVDYRRSMTERTRRLSKLRKDFLNSNLHEPNQESPFARTGMRASLPASSATVIKYKIESPNLYKFPFAEPYATPPPVRKVMVDLGPMEVNGEKENQDPQARPRHVSLPSNNTSPKIDHQKLFEELVKRYSPERKPIDWKLPPTRPRVVGSVPKSTSSAADSIDSSDKKTLDETFNKTEDDDVFLKREINEIVKESSEAIGKPAEQTNISEIAKNGPERNDKEIPANSKGQNKDRESKTSLAELEEKNDEVPELSSLQKNDGTKRPSLEKYTDLSIPALIEKINEEGEDLESHKKDKKVKRKRSFLDKLLGRKKDK
uniref:Uncharacterized protein n=1 Tax=Pectinophora gossypiella TaxID=13191 RepID=A0A1E1WB49_PECGO